MRKAEKDAAALYCERKAYFDSENLTDSFYHYTKDIFFASYEGDSKFGDVSHKRMCRLICSPKALPKAPFNDRENRKLLKCSRGTFKSTLIRSYATWRLGREYILTGKSQLRILFASESERMAKRNSWGVKQFLTNNTRFKELCGDHKGSGQDKLLWGITALTSRFRDPASELAEPTVSPTGVLAEVTGFHFNLILSDDLQDRRTSSSPEQMDKVYEFYRLLYALLVQDGTGELLVGGTYWHPDDIYQQIEDENEKLIAKGLTSRVFKILIIPARNEDTGSTNFPSLYPETYLQEVEIRVGPVIWATQYMLRKPTDDERTIREEHMKIWHADQLKDPQTGLPKRLNIYVSLDISFAKVKKVYFGAGELGVAYNVVLAVGIDEDWNYYILDWYRERSGMTEALSAASRMMIEHKAIRLLAQRFDQVHLEEAFRQFGWRIGHRALSAMTDYIRYPSDVNKIARIDTAIVPIIRAGKLYIHETMFDWFRKYELAPYPNSRFFDGLDALANVAYYSNPSRVPEKKEAVDDEEDAFKVLVSGGDPHDMEGDDDEWKSM